MSDHATFPANLPQLWSRLTYGILISSMRVGAVLIAVLLLRVADKIGTFFGLEVLYAVSV